MSTADTPAPDAATPTDAGAAPAISPALLARQRERLAELEAEAGEMAERIAERAWKGYTEDIDTTAEMLDLDDYSFTLTMLSMRTGMAFREAFEAIAQRAFERLQRSVTEQQGEEAEGLLDSLDFSVLELDAMRWSSSDLEVFIKFWLESALQDAKPGVGSMLGLGLARLWSDDSGYKAEERVIAEKNRRVRRALLSIRDRVTDRCERKARELIDKACGKYRQGLERLEREAGGQG